MSREIQPEGWHHRFRSEVIKSVRTHKINEDDCIVELTFRSGAEYLIKPREGSRILAAMVNTARHARPIRSMFSQWYDDKAEVRFMGKGFPQLILIGEGPMTHEHPYPFFAVELDNIPRPVLPKLPVPAGAS